MCGRGYRVALLLILAAILVAGCGPRYYQTFDPNYQSGYYTVRRGDTLYSISWRYGLDYRTVASWNGLRAPYTIHPGQRLRLSQPPQVAARAPTATPTRPKTASPSPPATATAPAAKSPSQPKTPAQSSSRPVPDDPPAGPVTWRWPTEGKVVRTFPKDGSGKRGIGIAGKAGQPILAAAGGRVVYSGSGLIGYGNLLIIKHSSSFLSAYGQNRELLVNEGDAVRAGQTVARMGNNEEGLPMLHFEIRQDGKPIDPLRHLPRR